MRLASWGLLLVAAIGIVGVAYLAAQERSLASEEDVVVVDVETRRYVFEPGSTVSLNVTEGSLVLLRIRSTDVTHGFAIIEYGINVEVPPGSVVEVKFRADRAGDFTIYCTVFCGSGHPQHKGVLHVG